MNFLFSAFFFLCCGSYFLVAPLIAVEKKGETWPVFLPGKELSCKLVKSVDSPSFRAISTMYKMDAKELEKQMQNTTIYCIYREKGVPIGAIFVEKYRSLSDLEKQGIPASHAKELFSAGKILELSYALCPEYQGKKLGSKSVLYWLEGIKNTGKNVQIFAVVEKTNIPSIKILEKCGFTHAGEFTEGKKKTPHLLYVSTEKTP